MNVGVCLCFEEQYHVNDYATVVHVEWSKVLARKWRWSEEVEILREEKRQTIRSLAFKAQAWQKQACQDEAPVAEEVWRGQTAYANKQVMPREQICAVFEEQWRFEKSGERVGIEDEDGEAVSSDEEGIREDGATSTEAAEVLPEGGSGSGIA